ncbi:hypothetical protein DM02DRAFT_698959 [Periconia macrospinosa]|uniref:Uncharacterized protein n=1 Tax=Periconia macrospinosa TaxID=97972 RepID=A0A2V1E0I5_9PLEO|nr:hypothetical protein DM02DRAFT_698959 [Periconia macrospinosa]
MPPKKKTPPINVFQDTSAVSSHSNGHPLTQGANPPDIDPKFRVREDMMEKELMLRIGTYRKPNSILDDRKVYGIMLVNSNGQDVSNPTVRFAVKGNGFTCNLPDTEYNLACMDLEDTISEPKSFNNLRAHVRNQFVIKSLTDSQFRFNIPASEGRHAFQDGFQQGPRPLAASSRDNLTEEVQEAAEGTGHKRAKSPEDKENDLSQKKARLESDGNVGRPSRGDSVRGVQPIELSALASAGLQSAKASDSGQLTSQVSSGSSIPAENSVETMQGSNSLETSISSLDFQQQVSEILDAIAEQMVPSTLDQLSEKVHGNLMQGLGEADKKELLVPFQIHYGSSLAPSGKLQEVWIHMAFPDYARGYPQIRFPMLSVDDGSNQELLNEANICTATQDVAVAFENFSSSRKVKAVARYYFYKMIQRYNLMTDVKLPRDLQLTDTFLNDLQEACSDQERAQAEAQKKLDQAVSRRGVAWPTGKKVHFIPPTPLPQNVSFQPNPMFSIQQEKSKAEAAQGLVELSSASSAFAGGVFNLHEESSQSSNHTLAEPGAAHMQEQRSMEIDTISKRVLPNDEDHAMSGTDPHPQERQMITPTILESSALPPASATFPEMNSPFATAANQIVPVNDATNLAMIIARRNVLRRREVRNEDDARVLREDRQNLDQDIFKLTVRASELRVRETVIGQEKENIEREQERLDRDERILSEEERMRFNNVCGNST